MAAPASEWSPYLASWPTAVPELPTDEEVLAISTGAARVVDAHTPGVPSGATYVAPAAQLPPAAWQWLPFGF